MNEGAYAWMFEPLEFTRRGGLPEAGRLLRAKIGFVGAACSRNHSESPPQIPGSAPPARRRGPVGVSTREGKMMKC
jgi:hypothetical protein